MKRALETIAEAMADYLLPICLIAATVILAAIDSCGHAHAATDPALNNPDAATGPLWSWLDSHPEATCAVATEGPGGRWVAEGCDPHDPAWCQTDGLAGLCAVTGGTLGTPLHTGTRTTGPSKCPRQWAYSWAPCDDGVDGATSVALACP